MSLRSGHTLPPTASSCPGKQAHSQATDQCHCPRPTHPYPTCDTICAPIWNATDSSGPARDTGATDTAAQSLSHGHNVARPCPVAGLSQVFQDLAPTWATTRDPQQIGYQPPVTGPTAPWVGVERERTDLEGESEPELAHLLTRLDGFRAAPATSAPECGSHTGRSRALTRASSRISMTSTQFKDTIDEALKAQAQQQAKHTLEMKMDMAAQAKQMEQLVRGAARKAATKATIKTPPSPLRSSRRRVKWPGATIRYSLASLCPLPLAPAMTDLAKSRSLKNAPRASAQNDHLTLPGTAHSDLCPHSPISSACPTSNQGAGTTIIPNRPVSPAMSRGTVSTDTDHQLSFRSVHDFTVQCAQPLRTQAAVFKLPPAQTPVATQPLPPASIAMPPMPTTIGPMPPFPRLLRNPSVRCTLYGRTD